MKKKILFVMHIDWRWIKQRPHFIAEGLSEKFDVTVVHFSSKNYLFKKYDVSNTNINIIPTLRLPLYQNRLIYTFNKQYLRHYFKFLIKKYNPDFIWLTFPQLYDYIPENINCNLIYDCMDLATGFNFSEDFKFKILDLEKKLINRSNLVFVSSNSLFQELNNIYDCEEKLTLVRNAFDGRIIDNFQETKSEKPYKIGYIGTISRWIDFQMIKRTLDEIEDIEYHFIGPCEVKNVLKEDRIKFHGVINHKDLYNYVKHCDCFIMPFKLNKLVKFVDPVKLYEYINYNKPIISIYYDELDYFSYFVHFYSDINEFIDLLKNLVEDGFKDKYDDSKRIAFLKENTWDVRIDQINKCMDLIN